MKDINIIVRKEAGKTSFDLSELEFDELRQLKDYVLEEYWRRLKMPIPGTVKVSITTHLEGGKELTPKTLQLGFGYNLTDAQAGVLAGYIGAHSVPCREVEVINIADEDIRLKFCGTKEFITVNFLEFIQESIELARMKTAWVICKPTKKKVKVELKATKKTAKKKKTKPTATAVEITNEMLDLLG